MSTATRIGYVDPATGAALIERDGALVEAASGRPVAPIVGGIPRFVDPAENYAEAFGFQWKTWRTLSDALHGGSGKREELLMRTRFDQYPTAGASLLECGMGGGDDTEVLLSLGFGQVHSFDLSTACERAAATLSDPRLRIAQASIFAIPYADESFDFVFCHRVLQHTPDPPGALRAVCRKVRPGGVLFAHCYKRSWRNMNCFKYKVRWLTKRLPHAAIYWYVTRCGPALHAVNRLLYRLGPLGRRLSHDWVPYYHYPRFFDLDEARLRELEQLNTFDALTPAYDAPMSTREFRAILEDEGFVIEHLFDPPVTPLWCTAVKRRVAAGAPA